MTDPEPQTYSIPPKSPLLMDSSRCCLAVIDVQEKLFPRIAAKDDVELAILSLLQGADCFDVPIVASEQYPERLGPTISSLLPYLGTTVSKRLFSCRECNDVWQKALPATCDTMVLCGIESHVCVQQTALDLLSAGWNVAVLADAIGSRRRYDHDMAVERMRWSGCVVTTVESILFEWCSTSTHERFRDLSSIVKSRAIDPRSS